jgi:hypothetical protein
MFCLLFSFTLQSSLVTWDYCYLILMNTSWKKKALYYKVTPMAEDAQDLGCLNPEIIPFGV